MRSLLLVPGIALVVVATYDTVTTTLAVGAGSGPVSGFVSRWFWRLLQRLPGRCERHRMLRRGGPLTLVLTLLTWIALAWAGWALIFASPMVAASALVVGIGVDVTDQTTAWHIASLLATAHGLFLLGLGIAYLIPVASAVAEKRKLAGHISTLGTSPGEMLARCWDGKQFGDLNLHLLALVPEVALLAQRHLAYPLVHYFHSSTRVWAAAPSIAALDEALTLLWYGVAPEHRPDGVACRSARAAILELVDTLRTNFIDHIPDPPPIPDLAALAACGIPTVSQEEFERELGRLGHRRALLRAYVEHDGWSWDDVIAVAPEKDPSLDDTLDPAKESPLQPVA
jgi:hypothetical protein